VAQPKSVSKADQPRVSEKQVTGMRSIAKTPSITFNRDAIRNTTTRGNRNYGRG